MQSSKITHAESFHTKPLVSSSSSLLHLLFFFRRKAREKGCHIVFDRLRNSKEVWKPKGKGLRILPYFIFRYFRRRKMLLNFTKTGWETNLRDFFIWAHQREIFEKKERNVNLIETQEICKTQKKHYFKFKKEREEKKE